MNKLKQKPRSPGFTLLELIVVITIIGIFGTLVAVKVTGWVGKARVMKIKEDLRAVHDAAEIYSMETGSLPESIEELKSPTVEGVVTGFKGEVKDPWGNEYYYEVQEGKPIVWCLGKDQAEGGEGEDLDYSYPDSSDDTEF